MTWFATWSFTGPQGPIAGEVESADLTILRYRVMKKAVRAARIEGIEREAWVLINHFLCVDALSITLAKGEWRKESASGKSWIAVRRRKVNLVKGGKKQ
ncbi:hypothetical protein AB0A77_05770 [Streptomyces varsoviensis]|uniref:hypothetical protein n=1 Tax=Streptomyces varsoviensis TaxID=67373 RepID=UPI0033E658BB